MDKNPQIFLTFCVGSTVLNCQYIWIWYYYAYLIRVIASVAQMSDVAPELLVIEDECILSKRHVNMLLS